MTRPIAHRSILPDYAREIARFEYSQATNRAACWLLRFALCVTAGGIWVLLVWAFAPGVGK